MKPFSHAARGGYSLDLDADAFDARPFDFSGLDVRDGPVERWRPFDLTGFDRGGLTPRYPTPDAEGPAASALKDWIWSGGRTGPRLFAEAVSQLDLAAAVRDAPLVCGCAYCMKGTSAFLEDLGGVGQQSSIVIVGADEVADDTSTTATVAVDGPHIYGTLETLGDQDFYAVQLVAGQLYDISLFAHHGGPNGVGVLDSYLELYDADGNLLLNADGGKPGDDLGLDAVLSYRAAYTGTYYVNARAFDDLADNGTTGDFVGDYELFVTANDGLGGYVPFYSADSPLHSIDWGTEVRGTSRNPDGDNGTRPNGTAPDGSSPIANNEFGIVGKNVITYYFARAGDVFVDENPLSPGSTDTMVAQGMTAWEKAAFETAFALYAQVADIVYIEVDNRAEADFDIITYNGTPGAGASLLGRMSPPGTEKAGPAEFNAGDVRWTEAGLTQGGFIFTTLLHELGHGHGLAHPHDNGGHSSIMHGAGAPPLVDPNNPSDPVNPPIGGALGDYGLSQQVYTVMSYNTGWQSPWGKPSAGGPTATQADQYGWAGSLSASDIAVIQDKYGVNEEWATGDDVYVLKDVNAPGTFYSCIWDAGGTDEIRYDGARKANIDLRAATLEYEYGGAGWMSWAWGIHGGFTIANGVTLENATSGSGDDMLTGNEAGNRLSSRGGSDQLWGMGGDDFLLGGAGNDELDGGEGHDVADYSDAASAVTIDLAYTGVQFTRGGGLDRLTSIEGAAGSAFADILIGSSGANSLSGGGGNDTLTGGAGADRFVYGAAGFGDDRIADFQNGVDLIDMRGLAGVDDFSDVRISSVGLDVVITFGDGADTIRLSGVAASSIGAEDFLFGGG